MTHKTASKTAGGNAGETEKQSQENSLFEIARRIQALAQAGLAYVRDRFDENRYRELLDIAAALMAQSSNTEKQTLAELFIDEKGYATPKVGVRCAVFRNGRILLVREKTDGLWALPGGWADTGFSLKENAEKEVLEESGLMVEAVRLLAVRDNHKCTDRPKHPFHTYEFFFHCTEKPGAATRHEFAENPETSVARFFEIDDLPPLSTHRTTAGHIRMCCDRVSRETVETYFE